MKKIIFFIILILLCCLTVAAYVETAQETQTSGYRRHYSRALLPQRHFFRISLWKR